jgi:hypothetical protein
MLQLIRQRQTPTWTWAASSTISQDIKASGAITRIDLQVVLTPSATAAGAIQPQGYWRMINALTLKGNGGVNYLSMGDQQIGRFLHVLNMNDKVLPGVGHFPHSTPVTFHFVLHFGSRPFDQYGRPNPFDLSAFVPAFDDSGLKIDWLTDAAAGIDDTITVTSAIMYATIYEVVGTKGEIMSEMHRQGVRQPMIPSSSYMSYAHTATFSDVSKDIDVPAGAFMRRIGIMAHDETATRPVLKDDEVTEVALKLPVGNQRVFFDNFVSMVYGQGRNSDLLVADDATTGGAQGVCPGIATLDLRQMAHPDYGLDLRLMKTGDVKLGVTIGSYAAGDDSFYWFDQVRPYKL